MAATDHLGQQWSVEDVGRLQSANRPGMTVAEEYDAKSRGDYANSDHEHARYYGFRDAGHYQAELDRHVTAHGIRNPSYWSPGEEDLGEDPANKHLVNGFHRYASARNVGLRAMPVAQYPQDHLTAAHPRVPGWKGGR